MRKMNDLTYKILGPLSRTSGVSASSGAQGAVMERWLPETKFLLEKRKKKYETTNHVLLQGKNVPSLLNGCSYYTDFHL